MSFFDKFKKQAGGVANNAVKQTKALASVGRMKLAVSSEEDKMKKAYTELGRLFYRDYEAGTERNMDDYQIWCDKVSDAKEQIARLTEEMEKVRAEAAASDPVQEPAGEAEEPEILEEEIVMEAETAAEEAAEAVKEMVETVSEETTDATEAPVVDTLYVDETSPKE